MTRRKPKATKARARARNVVGLGGPNVRPKSPSIKPTGALPPATAAQGSDAVAAYGGYVLHGERHSDLVGDNLWRTISETLCNTAIIAAAVRYSLNLIGGVEWEVIPNPHAKDQALAKKCAETVRIGLVDADMPLPWQSHVEKQALFRWYGFSLHNWIWRKRSDGLIVYDDIQHRPQYTIKRWDITAEGEPWKGVEQQTRNGGLYYIDRSRLWYAADLSITDSPVGVGLLRHVLEHARRLAHFEQLEGYAFDANLRGIPVGRAPLLELYEYARANLKNRDPDSYVDEQTAALQAFLTNHIKTPDQGMLLDSAVYKSSAQAGSSPSGTPQWAIDLLQGDDAGLAQICVVIERLNREIARVMFTEHMLMGDSEGARAVHEDKTSMYGAFLNSTTRKLGAFARNDLARPLVAANHGAEAAEDCTPLLIPSPISTGDIRTATGAILDMKQAGAFIPPDDPVFNVIRRRAEMPPAVKIPTNLMGPLPPPPPNPNDPTHPANGGDGFPPKPGAGTEPKPGATGKPNETTGQNPNDLRQGGDGNSGANDPGGDRAAAKRRIGIT